MPPASIPKYDSTTRLPGYSGGPSVEYGSCMGVFGIGGNAGKPACGLIAQRRSPGARGLMRFQGPPVRADHAMPASRSRTGHSGLEPGRPLSVRCRESRSPEDWRCPEHGHEHGLELPRFSGRLRAWVSCRFLVAPLEGRRGLLTEAPVTTIGVIPSLDELEDGSARLVMVVEVRAVEPLAFEGGEEVLGHGVVEAPPDRAYRRDHAPSPAALAEGEGGGLAPLVAVVDDGVRSSLFDGHVECIEHEFSAQVPGHRPAHDSSALLNPSARRLSSRSACAAQLRITWAVGSNCLPSADNNTAIPEPALPESVRCEPTRPSGAGRPAEPALRLTACRGRLRGNGGRSRFRHSGYLLPKRSGVHEIGSTPG